MWSDPAAAENAWLLHERRHDPCNAESLALIAAQTAQIAAQIDDLRAWQVRHEAASCDLVRIAVELQDLVANRRWVRSTARVVAWVGAAILATLLFWRTIMEEYDKWSQ